MNWMVIQRILGILLMTFSLTMIPPIFVSYLYQEPSWVAFLQGFFLTLIAGSMLWIPSRRSKNDLRLRDGFIIVAAFWTVL